MFQDIKHSGAHRRQLSSGKWKWPRYKYTIIDTDFTSTSKCEIKYPALIRLNDYYVSVYDETLIRQSQVISTIIDVYKQRNLNVAANLALVFKWDWNKFARPHPDRYFRHVSKFINRHKKHTPEFAPYVKTVEKYLIRLDNSSESTVEYSVRRRGKELGVLSTEQDALTFAADKQADKIIRVNVCESALVHWK